MNKISKETKQATIHYVLNWLNKNCEYEKQICKLSDEKDINKAYVISNRYARNYIHLGIADKKAKFLQCINELVNKCGDEDSPNEVNESQNITNEVDNQSSQVTVETLGNDIVKESDKGFIEKINESDEDINNKCKLRNIEKENFLLLMKSFFENNIIKVKKDFLDRVDVEKKLIGYKDGSEVYYYEGLNGVFEIV